jgi:hypothetical protein
MSWAGAGLLGLMVGLFLWGLYDNIQAILVVLKSIDASLKKLTDPEKPRWDK